MEQIPPKSEQKDGQKASRKASTASEESKPNRTTSFGDFFVGFFGDNQESFSKELFLSHSFMPWILMGDGVNNRELRLEILETFEKLDYWGMLARGGDETALVKLAVVAKVAAVELAAAVNAFPNRKTDILKHDNSWPLIVGFNGKADTDSLAKLRQLGFGSSIWGKHGIVNTDLNLLAQMVNVFIKLVRLKQIQHSDSEMQQRILDLPDFSPSTRAAWEEIAKNLATEVGPIPSQSGEQIVIVPEPSGERATWRYRLAIAFSGFAAVMQSPNYNPAKIAE